jgi:sugar O-acyltransferase (sialic acid O-acetyltransferase NeuD family)
MSSSLKKIYIFGASGFGREVLDTIEAVNSIKKTYEIQGFIDDDISLRGKVLNEQKVLGGSDYLIELSERDKNIYLAVAVGDSVVREKIITKIKPFVKFDNIIHPTAIISRFSKIGIGNIFQADVNVNANALIGDYCVFNGKTGLGHDSKISDFVSAMSYCDIMGNVTIKNGVYLGSSVKIHPGKNIDEYAKIGMGSIVITNIKAHTTVMGNPARRIS